METILIVPGLRDSGARHWQSWFEDRLPNCQRVMQRDWRNLDLQAWSLALRREIARAPGRSWIVAHSFGCLAAVHSCGFVDTRIAGAMLVAPADPSLFGVESALPAAPLGFPVLVVASENDKWMRAEKARSWARIWGAEFVNAGAAGHINAASGHGPWAEGIALLRRLQETSIARAEPHASV